MAWAKGVKYKVKQDRIEGPKAGSKSRQLEVWPRWGAISLKLIIVVYILLLVHQHRARDCDCVMTITCAQGHRCPGPPPPEDQTWPKIIPGNLRMDQVVVVVRKVKFPRWAIYKKIISAFSAMWCRWWRWWLLKNLCWAQFEKKPVLSTIWKKPVLSTIWKKTFVEHNLKKNLCWA